MKSTVGRFLSVLGAAAVLLLAANTVVFAATGSSFILGRSNSASSASTLTRTTNGAVLALDTNTRASAPFVTNGRGRVTNLNADMVDGIHASAFQAKIPPLVWHPLELINGWTNAEGTGSRTPAVAVDVQGIVHLRGAISCSTLPTACSTDFASLPTAIPAPSSPVGVGVDEALSGTGFATGRLGIRPDRTMAIGGDPEHPTAGQELTYLDDVTFAAG